MRQSLYLNEESINGFLGRFVPSGKARESVRVIVEESLESTNASLLERLSARACETPVALLARNQTAGVGRLGRKWHSEAGVVCMSVGVSFGAETKNIEAFTPLCGIEICGLLRETFGAEFLLKWPNDIYYKARKLSGMLANLIVYPKNCKFKFAAIMGVGMNCAIDNADELLRPQTADLREALGGCAPDVNFVAALIISAVLEAAKKLAGGNLSGMSSRFEKLDFLKGKSVSVGMGSEVFSGRAEGVNARGELLLRLPDNSVKSINSGEATILKK